MGRCWSEFETEVIVDEPQPAVSFFPPTTTIVYHAFSVCGKLCEILQFTLLNESFSTYFSVFAEIILQLALLYIILSRENPQVISLAIVPR